MPDEPDFTEIKTDINALLFRVLPGETTIDEVEEIAMKCWTAVCQKWEDKK